MKGTCRNHRTFRRRLGSLRAVLQTPVIAPQVWTDGALSPIEAGLIRGEAGVNFPITLLQLAGSVALLLWAIHMVQTGVQRAFGAKLARLPRPHVAQSAAGLPRRQRRRDCGCCKAGPPPV